MTAKADIGFIGLAVMGESMILNLASKGYSVACFNRTIEKVDAFLAGRGQGLNLIGCHSVKELVECVAQPRKVMLMVRAGRGTDDVIDSLIPLLEFGDTLIDGGNSHYTDTVRRGKVCAKYGIHFVGAGISGGEEGALLGPSIMPGGDVAAWPSLKPILQKIAAKVDGNPCCEWIGPGGAGHFVKIVHNGIEYGDIQIICEAYHIMAQGLGMSAAEMRDVFLEWNSGELDSYLIEITAEILKRMDPLTGKPLVDMILDVAGQKGTGKWTAEAGLDLGVSIPQIAEAVFARYLSASKEDRVLASHLLAGPGIQFTGDRRSFLAQLMDAVHGAKICSYAQGFQLLRIASKEFEWSLKFGEIASIWRGGCIIRARFLGRIMQAFEAGSQPANLMVVPYFRDVLAGIQSSWRQVIKTAVDLGIPVPALSSALSYYDASRCARLPANLLQAQRDYFGAHTYERIDRPRGEFFHTDWTEIAQSSPLAPGE